MIKAETVAVVLGAILRIMNSSGDPVDRWEDREPRIRFAGLLEPSEELLREVEATERFLREARALDRKVARRHERDAGTRRR